MTLEPRSRLWGRWNGAGLYAATAIWIALFLYVMEVPEGFWILYAFCAVGFVIGVVRIVVAEVGIASGEAPKPSSLTCRSAAALSPWP